MECKNCEGKMEYIACGDDPDTGYAFNLYICADGCDTIMKQSVWNDKSEIWIYPDNKIEKLGVLGCCDD